MKQHVLGAHATSKLISSLGRYGYYREIQTAAIPDIRTISWMSNKFVKDNNVPAYECCSRSCRRKL